MITSCRPHFLQPVMDTSHTGEARRWAHRLALDGGLEPDDAGRVSIIVTELAQNLVKHGGGGEIIMRSLEHEALRGFEVIAIDKGQGMDTAIAMEDGFSTAGTPGTGLGAVRRQTDVFDVFSAPRQGTIILARIWADRRVPPESAFSVGAVCVPVKGERECGDLWKVIEFGGRLLVGVVDGLGHGAEAAQAAEEAIRIFSSHASHSPCAILDRVHDALKKTRGAAMSIVEYAYGNKGVRYAGIGNISASLLTNEKSQSMVSHNGTLGAQIRRCQEFEYAFSPQTILVMHSDGLISNWDIKNYRGVLRKHPTLLAALLYRDYSRGRDDCTVLVARERTQ